MSGLFPGLPAFTPPFTGTEVIPMDTGATQGINPETAGISPQNLAVVGIGVVKAVTGTTFVECLVGQAAEPVNNSAGGTPARIRVRAL